MTLYAPITPAGLRNQGVLERTHLPQIVKARNCDERPRRTQGESRPEYVGRSTSPKPGVGRQLVRRVFPSARCTVYDHVSAGWSELCLLDGHQAANRLPATEASMSRPEELCTVTPVTSLPT